VRISQPSSQALAERAFYFQPPDPPWAGSESIARARRALREYSRELQVFWSPLRRFSSALPGRWRVVQWSKGSGVWSTLFFWEGPNGEYRPPDAAALLKEVMRCDVSNRGEHMGTIAKKIDEHVERAETKKEADQHDIAFREAADRVDYGHSDIAGGTIKDFRRRHNISMSSSA
jgi:hypothetical protein